MVPTWSRNQTAGFLHSMLFQVVVANSYLVHPGGAAPAVGIAFCGSFRDDESGCRLFAFCAFSGGGCKFIC